MLQDTENINDFLSHIEELHKTQITYKDLHIDDYCNYQMGHSGNEFTKQKCAICSMIYKIQKNPNENIIEIPEGKYQGKFLEIRQLKIGTILPEETGQLLKRLNIEIKMQNELDPELIVKKIMTMFFCKKHPYIVFLHMKKPHKVMINQNNIEQVSKSLLRWYRNFKERKLLFSNLSYKNIEVYEYQTEIRIQLVNLNRIIKAEDSDNFKYILNQEFQKFIELIIEKYDLQSSEKIQSLKLKLGE